MKYNIYFLHVLYIVGDLLFNIRLLDMQLVFTSMILFTRYHFILRT